MDDSVDLPLCSRVTLMALVDCSHEQLGFIGLRYFEDFHVSDFVSFGRFFLENEFLRVQVDDVNELTRLLFTFKRVSENANKSLVEVEHLFDSEGVVLDDPSADVAFSKSNLIQKLVNFLGNLGRVKKDEKGRNFSRRRLGHSQTGKCFAKLIKILRKS